MKRIIFSFYIDIPKNELDIFDKNILKEGQQPINYATKNAFKENYPSKDTYITKNHGIFLKDRFIRVKYLINGTTIKKVYMEKHCVFRQSLWPTQEKLLTIKLHY